MGDSSTLTLLYLLVGVIGWIVWPIVGSRIARSRGKSPAMGAAVGLFFGPLCLLLMLLTDPNAPAGALQPTTPAPPSRAIPTDGATYVPLPPEIESRLPKDWYVRCFRGVVEMDHVNPEAHYSYFSFRPIPGMENLALNKVENSHTPFGTSLSIEQFNNDPCVLFAFNSEANDAHFFAVLSLSHRHTGSWLIQRDPYELGEMFKDHPMRGFKRESIWKNGTIALLQSHNRYSQFSRVWLVAPFILLSFVCPPVGLLLLAALWLYYGSRFKNQLIGHKEGALLMEELYGCLQQRYARSISAGQSERL